MKLGQKTQHRCKWCHTWTVYKCGYSHTGIGGLRLSCSQCDGKDVLCDNPKHPSNKRRSDV